MSTCVRPCISSSGNSNNEEDQLLTVPQYMLNGRSSQTLLCVMASAIDSHERLRYFRCMLDSARAQIEKPDLFCVSIYVDPALQEEQEEGAGTPKQWLEDSARELAVNGRVKVLWQHTKKPQFVQYKELFQCIERCWNGKEDWGFTFLTSSSYEHAWISFSDDDDLWHPVRIQCWKQNIPRATANVSHLVMLQKTGGYDPTLLTQPIKTATDVDRLIKTKDLKIELNNQAVYYELANMCVRMEIVLQFFSQSKHVFLIHRNKYCDLALAAWAGSYATMPKNMMIRMPHWLYFWRKGSPNYSQLTQRPSGCSNTHAGRIAGLRSTAQMSEIVSHRTMATDQYHALLRTAPRGKKGMYRKAYKRIKRERADKKKRFLAATTCLNCEKMAATVINNGCKLMRCSVCKSANYCSSECQDEHWLTHKTTCH